MVRDVGLAEELAQDALVAALEQWPKSGIPDKPGRLADGRRQASRHRPAAAPQADRAQARGARPRARGRAARAPRPTSMPRSTTTSATTCCASIFTACHPVLATEARVALTLRLLGGLTTDEIARAFLVAEPTVAQRIVRAKRTLAEKQVPFEVPRGAELGRAARLGAGGDLPHLQRGLLGDRRRRLDAAAAVRGGAAPRPHPGRAGARRARGARPRRADGDPGLAPQARDQSLGRADPAARPEPRALGPAADPPRPRRAGSGRGAGQEARRRARPLCAAGRHRRLPCARAHRRGDRLGAHRRALRRAGRDHAVAGRRAQSRGRARHAVRSGGRAGGCRCADRRAGARRPITCCRACAATCCTSSAASRRPAPSSSAPPRSPATSASATCCSTAPRRAASPPIG